MKKLIRYIATTVLLSIIMVLGVVSAIYFIFAFVSEVGKVGQGSYTVWDAMLYILMSLPSNLYLVLPVAGLLGSLLGLGILANHSELVAMRAAGISVKQIGKGVIAGAVILTVLSWVLGAYVAPTLQYRADMRKNMETTDQPILVTANATWLKDGQDFVYIGKSMPNGELLDVVRYQIVANRLSSITQATSATFDQSAWHLHNVEVTLLKPEGVTIQHFNNLAAANLVNPKLLKVIVTTDYLTLPGIWSYIQYQKSNGLDASSFELNFWQVVLQPLSTIILMLMALPFVFGPLRSSTTGLRLIVGLLCGFAFFIVSQFFGPFSLLYKVPPFLGALLPCIVFSALLYWLIKRTH